MLIKFSSLFSRLGLAALAVVAVSVMTNSSVIDSAYAGHKMNETDLEVPTENMEIVEFGKGKYAQRCSFCHGGDGHGGKGPCLSCGKFVYTANTNASIYATIAGGIQNRSLGGTMGAFGTTMSYEEILSVLTFLRWEEARRVAAGEIKDPNKVEEQMVFPE
jgi:hypothetical protein